MKMAAANLNCHVTNTNREISQTFNILKSRRRLRLEYEDSNVCVRNWNKFKNFLTKNPELRPIIIMNYSNMTYFFYRQAL